MADAVALKTRGNEYVGKGEFEKAIVQYSRALRSHPDSHIHASLLTNLALCHLKTHAYAEAKGDCLAVLQFDTDNVKAYTRLGLAHYGLREFAEGDEALRKAAGLSRGKDHSLLKEIIQAYRESKRQRWEEDKVAKLAQGDGLRAFLFEVLERDQKTVLSQAVHAGQRHERADRAAVVKREQDEIRSQYAVRKVELEEFLRAEMNRLKHHEVPEHLCCPISCCLMQDPVITPSGVSYDRPCIEQHLARGNSFDPVTRRQLRKHDLIPNHALQAAVQAFIDENPWAVEELSTCTS